MVPSAISNFSLFDLAQDIDNVNRYAATPLDSSHYTSCATMIRAIQVISILALAILGTWGTIYFFTMGTIGYQILSMVCPLVVAKIGLCVFSGLDTNFLQKYQRWAGVSRIFEDQENNNNSLPIQRLKAHHTWQTEVAAKDQANLVHIQEELNSWQNDPFDEIDLEAREAVLQQHYAIKQNIAVCRIYAAYYAMLIDNHAGQNQEPDKRELIEICHIDQRQDIHQVAMHAYAGQFDKRTDAFLTILAKPNEPLTLDEVLQKSNEELQQLLLAQPVLEEHDD